MKSYKDTSPKRESITILPEWGGKRLVASQMKDILMETETLAHLLTLSPDTTIALDANSQGMYTISSWFSNHSATQKPSSGSEGMKGKHLRQSPPGYDELYRPIKCQIQGCVGHDAYCRAPQWADY